MDILEFKEKKQYLTSQGFAQLGQLLQEKVCVELSNSVRERLQYLIKMHGCAAQLYFSTVNRWPLTALVDADWQAKLIEQISKHVNLMVDMELQPFEIDVLYKSPHANLPTPCHQDISYVAHRPYLLSTWIALTDVSMLDSPLQFLPGSHLASISPAVDFWQPDFIDEFRGTMVWQQQAVTLPVKTGDGLIFSARIWHGSLDYQASGERFALVIRWGNANLQSPVIPKPEQSDFGMWNCGESTQSLLQQGLLEIFNVKSDQYLEIIKIWQKQLKEHKLPFHLNIEKADIALEKLRILNEAYQIYGAGDGQGIVYVEVWRKLLCPLNSYLREKSTLIGLRVDTERS